MVQQLNFEQTSLQGLVKVTPFCATDDRGNFIKDFEQEKFAQNGINLDLKEVFYTTSKKGVVRAMHFQRVKEQGKLVRVIKGCVQDVCVDLRRESPTFGQWLSFELSDKNQVELYIPRGFGHGYLVKEDSIVSYKCDEKFYGEYDDGIRWNDSTLAIQWETDEVEKIILSQKDETLQSFLEFQAKQVD